MPFQARKISAALGLKGDLFNAGVKLITGVYNTWWECDAAMVELNPLAVVELADGKETVVALDAKISWMTTRSTATRTFWRCAT
jgi:succinyl-CoA synthetase beta subunit